MDNCFSNFELVNLNKFHELARGQKNLIRPKVIIIICESIATFTNCRRHNMTD